MKTTSEEIAEYIDGEHVGDMRVVDDVDALDHATARDVAFCRYDDRELVVNSNAGTVITLPSIEAISGKTLIRTENPELEFYQMVLEFFADYEETIHPTAVIHDTAMIGNNCIIGPNVYLGEKVTVGDQCQIGANTVIGSEGFGFVQDESGRLIKETHTGSVSIGDKVEIGSNCSIDRATFGETTVGNGTKIDNLVHIAHNVEIGENVRMTYNCGISGSVKIQEGVYLHPNIGVADHVTIGRSAVVGMNAAVLDDVEPHSKVAGIPAEPI